MLNTRHLLMVSAGIFIISAIPASESVLWDLLITASVENGPLNPGEDPIVSGHVADHGGDPVANATIQITAGHVTANTTTDNSGEFRYEFSGLSLLPGGHGINIGASLPDGKTGLVSAGYKVIGDIGVASHTARMLETTEAKKYLNSDPEKYADDPIGAKLYEYYQNLMKKFLAQKQTQDAIDEQKRKIAGIQSNADELEQQEIDKENPGSGTYSGYTKDRFVAGLNPAIRDTIERQMNFTSEVFREAQKAMNQVLQDGGTYQEARSAYHEKASVSREMLDLVTYKNYTLDTFASQAATNHTISNQTISNQTVPIISNQTAANATSTEGLVANATESDAVSVNLNGTDVRIGFSEAGIFLDINGTLVKFMLNGTDLIRVNQTE